MRYVNECSFVLIAAAACGPHASSARSAPTTPPAPPVVSVPPAETAPAPVPMAVAIEPNPQGVWDLAPAESLPPPAIADTPLEHGADDRLLPEDFKVYVRGSTVRNHPFAGAEEKTLPTVNDFKGRPGCYIACHSGDRRQSVYPAGGGIWVKGQLRVPGSYEGSLCRPLRFDRVDISRASVFKEMCRMAIPACGQDCWAGGDTGAWFGR